MIKVITTFPPFLKKKETKGMIQNKINSTDYGTS